eukprot:6488361-Pyramimonas_sp.AAC.1
MIKHLIFQADMRVIFSSTGYYTGGRILVEMATESQLSLFFSGGGTHAGACQGSQSSRPSC